MLYVISFIAAFHYNFLQALKSCLMLQHHGSIWQTMIVLYLAFQAASDMCNHDNALYH